MHGNSKAKKVILGNRVRKVRNDKVHKEKGLIKRKARGHIEQEGRERHEHVGYEVCGARETESTRASRAGDT